MEQRGSTDISFLGVGTLEEPTLDAHAILHYLGRNIPPPLFHYL